MFERYLKSNSGGKKDPKNAGNERAQLRRMMAVICKDNTPHYLQFANLKIVEELWVKGLCREKKYEPGTIVARNEVGKWRSSLRAEEDQRQYEVMIEDGDNMLTRADFCSVLESDFYKQVLNKIMTIAKMYNEKSKKPNLNLETFVNIRDCLLFNMIVCNISRSGAAANMTLEEYNRGMVSPTGQYVVHVKKHKTSRKYGPCQIVIREEMKKHFDTYLNIVRSQVPGNKSEHFFTAWSGVKMESGGVSTQVSTFFEKCLGADFCKERKISATLIRKSLLTYIYDTRPEMKEELGNLMKHNPKTGERFYHLSRLRKECSATSEKVHEAVFGKTGDTRDPDYENENENENENDTDASYDDDDLPDLKKPRKTWTKEEEELLIDLFGDTSLENCHLPLIRQVFL